VNSGATSGSPGEVLRATHGRGRAWPIRPHPRQRYRRARTPDSGPHRRGRSLRRSPRSRVSRLRASAHGAHGTALRRSGDGIHLFHLRDALVSERRHRAARLPRSCLDPRARTHRRPGDDAPPARRGTVMRRARSTVSGAGYHGRSERRFAAGWSAPDRGRIEAKADRHRQRSAYWYFPSDRLAAALLYQGFALGQCCSVMPSLEVPRLKRIPPCSVCVLLWSRKLAALDVKR